MRLPSWGMQRSADLGGELARAHLQDICKPESARLRRNLSAIINFAKFREEKLAPYAEAQEEGDALADETAVLEDANARLVRARSSRPVPPACPPCTQPSAVQLPASCAGGGTERT